MFTKQDTEGVDLLYSTVTSHAKNKSMHPNTLISAFLLFFLINNQVKMDRYGPVYHIRRICNKIRQERKISLSTNLAWWEKNGVKENIKNVHAKKMFCSVINCKQNK